MVDCGPLNASGMTTFARLEALKSLKYTYVPKPNGRGVVDIHNVPIVGVQGNESANKIEIRNLTETTFQVDGRRESCLWDKIPGMVYWRYKSVLHFVRLPGPIREVPLKAWKVDIKASGSWEAHMDSHQNLLVLIPQCVYLWIWSFQSGNLGSY